MASVQRAVRHKTRGLLTLIRLVSRSSPGLARIPKTKASSSTLAGMWRLKSKTE